MVSDPTRQFDLFKPPFDLEDQDQEYLDGWTLDTELMRLYRLRWERGIEVVHVAGGRL